MQCLRDGVGDRFDILFHILVNKTQHLPAYGFEMLVTLQIAFHDVVVIAPINLDDQLLRRARKVHDPRIDWILAAKLQAAPYTVCRQAVQDALARERPPATTVVQCAAKQSGSTPEAATGANHQPGSHSNGNGNGNAPYAASEKQLWYINQLARQIKGLGARRLEALAQQMYGKKPAALTSLEASALIDQLKALKSGELNLEGPLSWGPRFRPLSARTFSRYPIWPMKRYSWGRLIIAQRFRGCLTASVVWGREKWYSKMPPKKWKMCPDVTVTNSQLRRRERWYRTRVSSASIVSPALLIRRGRSRLQSG